MKIGPVFIDSKRPRPESRNGTFDPDGEQPWAVTRLIRIEIGRLWVMFYVIPKNDD